MENFLTGGAARALGVAARLAGNQEVDVVSAAHLLAAFLLEEGMAGEYLSQNGVGLSQLQAAGEMHWHPAWEQSEHPPRSPEQGLEVQEILRRARNRAHSGGRPSETDTLDLLAGLLELDSPSSRLLLECGISATNFLRDDPADRTGAGTPLPMEESLRLESSVASSRMSVLRILDAAANRLREGIRVVEDYVRFHRNDAYMAEWLKRLRHGLTAACRELPTDELLAARNTDGDVGTQISLSSEMSRQSLEDVLWANMKRCQEGCRTLEEYGKLISGRFAQQIEQLRYELYTLEKGLRGAMGGDSGWPQHNLYLLVTEDLCRCGTGPVIRGALQGGVRIIQIREKRMSDRKLVEHARRVREWTREFGAILIMNDRPDLAVIVEADGVHVGQEELSVADARKIVGPKMFVGVSTHSLAQAEQALREGADVIGVGPVFPSKTKEFSEFVGLDLVRQVNERMTLPAYAIGGIDATNLASVLAAGACRVAVSSAICGAEDPEQATAQLLGMLGSQIEA